MIKINIKAEIDKNEYPLRVIYISSYFPRKCGIASFTKDLTTAVNNLNPLALAEIIAIDDNEEEYEYPWEVKTRIQKHDIQSYISAAHYINQSSADVVNLQHEFSLFGGTDGDYILLMMDLITKPIVTCFHSILPDPSEHRRYIIKKIIEKSATVIAMSETSRKLLVDVYGALDENAVLIYIGVPDFTFTATTEYKKKLNINTKNMLLVMGLIGSGKGIEYVIQAMPAIIKEFPNTEFRIAGQTHPTVIKSGKDDYREYLINLVKENNLVSVVKFDNRYIPLDEFAEYYKACDIYLTPHLDPQQTSSYTLAYALGAGKACISTPYIYAKEMLANDVGVIVPFKDSQSISNEVIAILKDENIYNKYRENAYKFGRQMQWSRIGYKYLKLLRLIKENINA